MKTVVAIRHVFFEDLGILEPLLRDLGYSIQYVDPTTDDLAQVKNNSPDLLVVLGGPIGANDDEQYPFLKKEAALIRQRLNDKRPLVGICLGAQLIARELGADVHPLERKEIGFGALLLSDKGLASPLKALNNTPILHWHGDQFGIPSNATRLAGTPACHNQAFSVGSEVLGLQFHAETDLRLIERWLVGHSCELNQAGISPSHMREQARRYQNQIKTAASDLFTTWLTDAEHTTNLYNRNA